MDDICITRKRATAQRKLSIRKRGGTREKTALKESSCHYGVRVFTLRGFGTNWREY